jgi:hypothetical protein
MTTPQEAPVQVQVGLADTPFGQRVALVITILLAKDGAEAVAAAIKQTTATLSTSGLYVANGSPQPIASPGGGDAVG